MEELERIKAEKNRLLSLFSDIDENELEVVKGLISQAAFMQITLENLQGTIHQNGCTDEYKNGKDQYGTKQSSELQAYNQTLRSYNAVIGKLLKLVPRKTHIETPEQIAERFRKERELSSSTREELEKWHQEFCEMLKKDREKYNNVNDN